ncbi:(2Fe-2S)-binding protein [Kineosporia babensis]|uniref:(2Fe-2S)-binding protein n=1 Tax=Kineosporia babensis TaxID=499548 RepID=A0A9X1SUB2_9ACTN|nr:(2Fe-2S)-binding protein [Kineosporia babensis]MCD5312251.1 (2Fe-2S)-binding protein [Kineosporia babensis]
MSVGGLPEPIALLPGSLLLDEDWLSGQVRDTGTFYGCAEPRLNATLWWYSASAVLLGPAVHELALLGSATSVRAADVRLAPRRAGLERVVPGPSLAPGGLAFGAHLDLAVNPMVDVLARVGGATPQSLWAITADSLATRLLASVRFGPPDALAEEIAAGSEYLRPAPRFVRVQGKPFAAPSTYVHRVSCCLLYRVPMGKCLSCPRQTPEERTERLEAHARSTVT